MSKKIKRKKRRILHEHAPSPCDDPSFYLSVTTLLLSGTYGAAPAVEWTHGSLREATIVQIMEQGWCCHWAESGCSVPLPHWGRPRLRRAVFTHKRWRGISAGRRAQVSFKLLRLQSVFRCLLRTPSCVCHTGRGSHPARVALNSAFSKSIEKPVKGIVDIWTEGRKKLS